MLQEVYNLLHRFTGPETVCPGRFPVTISQHGLCTLVNGGNFACLIHCDNTGRHVPENIFHKSFQVHDLFHVFFQGGHHLVEFPGHSREFIIGFNVNPLVKVSFSNGFSPFDQLQYGTGQAFNEQEGYRQEQPDDNHNKGYDLISECVNIRH